MTNRKLVKTLAGSTTLVLVLLATAVVAQEAPFNTTEIGNFDQPGQVYADVWGDGNFAYLAHFGQRVVDIIDISDPANPTLAATYDSNVNSASAQDVKVADGLMFVGLESVTPGCQIVDVRDPFNPVKLTDVTVRSGVHNVFYDEGWLYLVDSSQTQIDVIDLRTYDPDNAPATISDFTWRLTNVGGDFVHDITVKDGRLYASAWDSQRVYNVTDLANQAPIFMGSVPGSSSHASWPTDDGRFLAVAEEHGTGGLTLFEIFDDGITVEFEQRDYYFVSSARAGTVHNPLVVGHRVYASWYAVGVLVLEIDPDTATWDLVASFDTTAADGNSGLFDGCWGVYPFLGEDRVLASDDNNGLWVIDVDPNVLLFRYPNGRPATIQPVTPTPISVEVSSVGAPVAPASVTLHASVDGGPTVDQAMADAGGGLFTANLPAASCGSVVDYSFSADNTLGTEFVDPTGAIGTTYRTRVSTQLTRVFEDTFETDLGWTVNNSAATGAWERDDPNGTGAQPENDFDGDLDDFCFFTGQANPGSSIGNQDVDGGPTTLISPTIDFSAGDGLITYAFWFFTNDEETADDLIVEITNDGASWIPVTRHAGFLGGWEESSFLVSDFVTPNDEIQIRFQISDGDSTSITEAAIDFVRADVLDCSEVAIFIDGFESGNTTAWSAASR